MSQNESFIKKHRTDIIVISLILLLSIAILLVTNLTRTEGGYAEVEIDGTVVGKYPLSVDAVYSLNGGSNTLTIEDGFVYMSYSNCPDHTCENIGKAKYQGQTIVCLPNRLSITIVGDADDSVDFVS